MTYEFSEEKIKKGYIAAHYYIGFSETKDIYPDFTPKTISNIVYLVDISAGASLRLFISGRHTFPLGGDQDFLILDEILTQDTVAKIDGCNFHKYVATCITDASTRANVYLFFEYDYDLIK